MGYRLELFRHGFIGRAEVHPLRRVQALIRYRANQGTDPMTLTICNCGSGHYPRAALDARGIFLAYVCDRCERRRLASFRPEVLTDPNYDADDLGDDEDM